MTELDGNLAEWAAKARNDGPVTVDRYEAPWVTIVAFDTWLDLDNLKSYIPSEEHALVRLREEIDSALSYESTLIHELTQRCESRVDARVVIRAWVLGIVYSTACAAQVREKLQHDMLWRWFIGYDHASEPLPESEAFVRDMRMVSAVPRVVETVYHCLIEHVLSRDHLCEFCVNLGLLHTLREHHLGAMQESERTEKTDPGGDEKVHG